MNTMLAQFAAPAGAAAWQAARAATTPAANSFAKLLASSFGPAAAREGADAASDAATLAGETLARLEQSTLARLDQLLADEAPLLGDAIELRVDPQDGRIVASEDGFELPRISQLLNDDAEFASQFRELVALRQRAGGHDAPEAASDAPHPGWRAPLAALYVLPDGGAASFWQWQAQASDDAAWDAANG